LALLTQTQTDQLTDAATCRGSGTHHDPATRVCLPDLAKWPTTSAHCSCSCSSCSRCCFPEGQKEPILARQPLRLHHCNPAHRLTCELALTKLETDMNLLEQCNRAQEAARQKHFTVLCHTFSLFSRKGMASSILLLSAGRTGALRVAVKSPESRQFALAILSFRAARCHKTLSTRIEVSTATQMRRHACYSLRASQELDLPRTIGTPAGFRYRQSAFFFLFLLLLLLLPEPLALCGAGAYALRRRNVLFQNAG
jgi:hypothetical protein